MHRRALLLLLILMASLLAGCSSQEPMLPSKSVTPTPTPTTSAPPTPTLTATPPPATSTSTTPPQPPPSPGTTTVDVRRTTPANATGLGQAFTVSASFRTANGASATPSPATWAVTYRQVRALNGIEVSSPTLNGPTGQALPASFQLTFPGNGTFLVKATVKASGFGDGEASLETLVLSPPRLPLLVDGAENGTSQWTFSGWWGAGVGTLVAPNAAVPTHPNGTWMVSQGDAHSGTRAWTAPYPDDYNTTMMSVPIAIPADGRHHRLSYWLRGGVENNPQLEVDGLHVYILADSTLAKVQYVTDDHDEWTLFEVPLDDYRGKTIQIGLSFQADGFCSQDNTANGRKAAALLFGSCDDSSYTGYRVDDILVM